MFSQPANSSIPCTEDLQSHQGRLLLYSKELLGAQDTKLGNLPCHNHIGEQAPQQIPRTDKHTVGTSRHLLAAQTPKPTPELDTDTANTDPDLSAPNITLRHSANSSVDARAAPDLVKDAADQQAMRHGAGALSNRGLQRQLGQRFEKSPGDQGPAKDAAAAGQMPPEALKLQSEITPGNALCAWSSKAAVQHKPSPCCRIALSIQCTHCESIAQRPAVLPWTMGYCHIVYIHYMFTLHIVYIILWAVSCTSALPT